MRTHTHAHIHADYALCRYAMQACHLHTLPIDLATVFCVLFCSRLHRQSPQLFAGNERIQQELQELAPIRSAADRLGAWGHGTAETFVTLPRHLLNVFILLPLLPLLPPTSLPKQLQSCPKRKVQSS
jgi:hypothetical protein